MRSIALPLLAALLGLAACQPEPVPPPPAPVEPAADAPDLEEPEPEPAWPEPAARPPVEPLDPAAEAFWFGPRGAPPPLGLPAPRPPLPPSPWADESGRYLLGPGDVLELRLPEEPDLGGEVTVAPDGTVALDLVGTVEVEGLTLDQASERLTERFRRFVREARPQLVLKEPRPRPQEVTVVGPVAKPGSVSLRGQRSLLEVLGEVGYGGEPRHLEDRITVLRGERALTLAAHRVLKPTDPRWNLRLRPADVVVIHPPGRVMVHGEVASPGALDLPPSGQLGVAEALARAGGLTEEADLERATITREWGRVTQEVDLNPVVFGVAGAGPPLPPLRPGDSINVPAGKPLRVFVFGMVENPGLQRHRGAVSLVAAVSEAQPKQFGAVLDATKLVRGWPDDPAVVDVDLEAILYEGAVSLDVALRDGDVVYVPETALSDALDVLQRTLGPLSGPASAAGSILTARQAARR